RLRVRSPRLLRPYRGRLARREFDAEVAGVCARLLLRDERVPDPGRNCDAELGEHEALAGAVGPDHGRDGRGVRRKLRGVPRDLGIVPVRDRAGEDLARGLARELELDGLTSDGGQAVHEREAARADGHVDETARERLASAAVALDVRNLGLHVLDVGGGIVERALRELRTSEGRALRDVVDVQVVRVARGVGAPLVDLYRGESRT